LAVLLTGIAVSLVVLVAERKVGYSTLRANLLNPQQYSLHAIAYPVSEVRDIILDLH
jgi:hypothetical protein